jgi:putative ABC transport system substrate-binding protein
MSQALPVLGYLSATSRESPYVRAFLERLRELDYEDGRNIRIEFRFASARFGELDEYALDLVKCEVDVILAGSTPAIRAAQQATTRIPIVMGVTGNPVGAGFVKSMARPGGNITGMADHVPHQNREQLDLLREMLPGLRRVGVLHNGGNPGKQLELDHTREAGRYLSLDVGLLDVRSGEDLGSTFARAAPAQGEERLDAVIVLGDPLLGVHGAQIRALAVQHRIPLMYGASEAADMGGLIAYGPNHGDVFRRAADYVDWILQGVEPSTLPVGTPTRLELAVNLETAAQIGCQIPESILNRANRVIGRRPSS